MLRIEFLALAAAASGALLSPFAARAQSESGPAASAPASKSNPQLKRSPFMETLADVLDKVIWNSEEKGTLLIVSSDETTVATHTVPIDVGMSGSTPAPPMEPDAKGYYPIREVEAHFDRRLVGLHSLSVLAPTTMKVLNASHLPKPDAYAGMTENEKAKLLLSTLTKAQWGALSSVDGIGVGDLDRKQRDIYLSMLPEPFRVSKTEQKTFADGKTRSVQGVPAALSAEQREQVRFSLNKAIEWSFLTHPGGGIQLGNGEQTSGSSLRVGADSSEFTTPNEAFGVALCDDVPNRSKSSQLPYDWGALNVTMLSLNQVKTVGDLIHRIAEKCHAELYCDPRYADRAVTFRGESAQAGDILHALAWAVTGTWRRLGPAFVLTNDIVGLGVQHATIGNWVQENSLLGQARQMAVDKELRDGRLGTYLGWSDADPMKPGDDLIHKIEAYDKDESARMTSQPLIVPMADLTPAAQALAQRQVESYASRSTGRLAHMPDPSEIRMDSVNVRVKIHAAYIIPGMGAADAPNIGGDKGAGNGNLDDILLGRTRFQRARTAPPTAVDAAAAIAFSPDSSVRALIVTSQTDADIAAAAQAAHQHGFTEIWVHAQRGHNDLISAAVRAGKANGLAVRPVFELLRAVPTDKPEWLDRNILGETLGDHARWWLGRLNSIGLPGELPGLAEPPPPFAFITNFATPWPDLSGENNLIKNGDYLRCDDADAQAKLIEDAASCAAIAGIAGVVLSDTIAPGYGADSSQIGMDNFNGSAVERDPLLQMGYTDALRLAYLRMSGLDPIDLSPLMAGGQIQVSVPFGKRTNLELPLFLSGGGAMAERSVNNDGLKHSPISAAKAWHSYRESVRSAFLNRFEGALRTRFPDLSIVLRRENDPVLARTVYFGSLEAPAATATDTATPSGAVTGQPRDSFQEAARAASKTIYYSVAAPLPEPDTATGKVRLLQHLRRELKNASSWDGVVLDLNAAPIAQVLDVLAVLPSVTAPIPETAPKP